MSAERADELDTTPLSQRPIAAAMAISNAARLGARILRIMAAAVAMLACIGHYLRYSAPDSTLGREDVADLLLRLSFPLALAGMLYGASFVLIHSAAQLDLDTVRAATPDRD